MSTPSKRANDTVSFAKSAVIFNVTSTVAHKIEDEEDDSSILLEESLEGVDKERARVNMKKREAGSTSDVDMKSNKGKVNEEMDASSNIFQEDEQIANEFEEAVKIMEGKEREEFMKMKDSVKKDYLEYKRNLQETGEEPSVEEEEVEIEKVNQAPATEVTFPESDDEKEEGGEKNKSSGVDDIARETQKSV